MIEGLGIGKLLSSWKLVSREREKGRGWRHKVHSQGMLAMTNFLHIAPVLKFLPLSCSLFILLIALWTNPLKRLATSWFNHFPKALPQNIAALVPSLQQMSLWNIPNLNKNNANRKLIHSFSRLIASLLLLCQIAKGNTVHEHFPRWCHNLTDVKTANCLHKSHSPK